MRWVAGWRRVVRAHPTVADALLAAALLGTSLLPVDPPGGPPQAPLTVGPVLLTVAGCAALTLRRRYPLPVLGATTAAVVATMSSQARGPFVIVVAVAAYTVATRTDRRTAALVGAASALAVAGSAVLTLGLSPLDPAVVVLLLWFGVAVAVGDAVRTRRAYVAVLEERAHRAERTREEEARRRVAEERLRIARELHDVVAHHIALINVQAGVAGHLLRGRPDADREALAPAQEALAHVRSASRTVLDELATLLGVLRRADPDTGAPTEPAPSLNRLDALVEGFATAGRAVHWTLAGQPRPLPSAVDVAAYRIIQESLTNAHKHAGGAAVSVRLRYDPAGLTIEVRDDGAATPAELPGPGAERGTGLGLAGMRERAEALGGTFSAGPHPAGGFVVRAELPAPEEVAPDDPGTAG